jgi:hypothetical protein
MDDLGERLTDCFLAVFPDPDPLTRYQIVHPQLANASDKLQPVRVW